MLEADPTASSRMVPPAPPGLNWLEAHAWPLWLERGVDWKRRAFLEHLDLATLECRAEFRRLRVAARQTYVFSKAAAHGVAGAAEAVALGLEFLRGPARLADGGFAWRFDLDNRPIDRTRDLYDHAFVLLAFATAATVMGADELREDAAAVGRYITTSFRHARGGYEETIPAAQPRRPNSHMHLFEALLAAHEAFAEDVFFDQASELAELFLRRLFQMPEGAVAEFFNDALAPLQEGGRFRVEPGHHYEWVWLLDWYANHASADGARWLPEFALASDALLEFAERHAVAPACGLVVNEVWSDGTVEDSGYRLWPQTERLKALARRGDAGRFAAALRAFERHFAGVHPGLWIERFDAAGRATQEPAPATSLYHLTAALTDAAVMARTV